STLNQVRPSFITHCPNTEEFFAAAHALGVRCIPYMVFTWGPTGSVGPSPTNLGPPSQIIPSSNLYNGIDFAENPGYFWYPVLFDPQRPANGVNYQTKLLDGVGFEFLPLPGAPAAQWLCPNNPDVRGAVLAWVQTLMDAGADGVF